MPEQEIRVGQVWARKRDGKDFVVTHVGANDVQVRDAKWNHARPWRSTFLKAYELVKEGE